jgi:hypothetical protein
MQLTYIYVKRLPNGLLYLGKTEAKDPYKYKGSGTRWLSEIKKFGYTNNDIETWILHKTKNREDLVNIALYYSKLFDVVNSDCWANLKNEEGDGGNTVGGTVVVKKENHAKHIKKSELEFYINNGWKRCGHTKGLIFLNNGNNEKRVKEHDVSYYVNLGWKIGRIKKHNKKLKNLCWINNGSEEKRVDNANLNYYTTNNWIIGRLPEIGQKVSNKQKNSKRSESAKNKMKASWTKEKRINQSNRMLGDKNPSKNAITVKKQLERRKEFYEKNPEKRLEINKKNMVKISQYDLQGRLIKDWDSIKSICEQLGITRNTFKYSLLNNKILCESLWNYKNKK